MNTFNTPEEAIDAMIKLSNENPKFIDFDGKNCEDADMFCMGWDGISRRCDCGNRRVYWATMKLNDGTYIAYAEAY